MKAFLLDQNVNRKTLWRNCNEGGLAEVKRFPPEWSSYPGGFKDPQLLPIVMAGTKTLLTNDRGIARDHENLIPNSNPGIVIVGFPIGHIRPIGKGDIERIIEKFKSRFPRWHEISWENSITEITTETIEIWHAEAGHLKQDVRLQYADAGWDQRLAVVLERNSALHLPKLPAPDKSDGDSPTNGTAI